MSWRGCCSAEYRVITARTDESLEQGILEEKFSHNFGLIVKVDDVKYV